MRMDKIPETLVTGTDQKPAPEGSVVPMPFDPFPSTGVTDAIVGIASSNARSMGAESVAKIVASWTQQLTTELRQSRRQVDQLQSELAAETTRTAVLTERLGTKASTGKLQLLLTTVGMAVVGIAIDLYKNNLEKLAYVLGGVGALLVIVGWIWPMRWTRHE